MPRVSLHQGHHQPSLGAGRDVGSRVPLRLLELSLMAAGLGGGGASTGEPTGRGHERELSLRLVSSLSQGLGS